MAIGRIKRRHTAPTTPQSSPLCSTVSVTIIAVIVFCSLTFELTGKHDPAGHHDTCHSKCNNHLQQSASIPSAMNALFQSQGMFDQQQKSILQGNEKSSAARPRRLPTLIKILTGFSDEHQTQRSSDHYDNDRPIIVRRIDRQEFIDQSKSDNPTRQAAFAAAAAVFSQSLRVYGNHRMKNVNAEWEAALRWIAGWDHNQMTQPSLSSNRGNNRGYNSTDDMEKMLEECIKQCIDDKDSDITVTLGEDERSSEELEMHGFIGESTLSSFFDWVASFSFSKLSLRTMVSSESLYILTKTFQFVASSMAMYALHSIWVWTSPVISTWYTSLGYTIESPEWLLEHERELQQAKSSRSRQRKKSKSKRRQQQTRKAAKQGSKQTPIKEEVQVHQKEDPTDKNIVNRDCLDSNRLAKNRVSPPPDPEPRKKEETQGPTSKADDSSSQLSEGIPSLITYSTTSASIYSPSFKPLPSSHFDDHDIPQETLLHSKPTIQGPVFPQLSLNGLSVPTQEQRAKAANQLREFQAAQIQKILMKKKLAQSANNGISSLTATPSRSVSSIAQPKKVMKPPPGFSQPSESILPDQNDDNGGFLSNNEVFLSKLLDDDDEDNDKKTSGVKSSIYNVPSMSPEPPSSLNPAAAPFIGSNIEEDQVTSPNVTKMKKEDSWHSKPSDISFKDSPAGGIKGVYGGSVW